MTQCHQIDAFLDRRMSSDEAAEFESHAARCADCAAMIEQWGDIEREVTKIADARWGYEPTPMAAQRLVQRATRRSHERVRPAWGLRLGVGFAAAAAVVLAVVGVQLISPAPPATLRLALIDGETDAPLVDVANAGTILASAGQRRVLVQLGDDRVGVSRFSRVEIVEAVANHTRLKLHAGSVGLRVAKRKAGDIVEVEVAGTLVTVVGTRFMVSLPPAGGIEVNVAEGRVRVEVPGHESVEVSAEEALHVTKAGGVRTTPMSTHAGRSLGRLLRDPDELPATATRAAAEREKQSTRSPSHALHRRPTPTRAKVEADLDLWRDWVLAGRYDAAERSLVGYLKSAQRDVEAWSLLADCRRKKNDWTGAV
ncbi:MAG: FecR domain-containing protein, partial [Myxococcota bacterium]